MPDRKRLRPRERAIGADLAGGRDALSDEECARLAHAADPFGDVWDVEVMPLLKDDDKRVLQATTPIELLQKRHPGQFIDGQARTLQRRLRDWRAVNGPTQDVFFEQRHVAGREAAVDFTHATELGVTIRGALLEHLLFEFVMSFSGWTWVCLAFGETYEALVFGIQGALAALGGAPRKRAGAIAENAGSAGWNEPRIAGLLSSSNRARRGRDPALPRDRRQWGTCPCA